MDEQRWLAARYAGGMISSLWSRAAKRGPVIDQRFRRFGIACTRRALAAFPGGNCPAFDLAEASIGPRFAAVQPEVRRLYREQIKRPERPCGPAAFAHAGSAILKCFKLRPTQAAVSHESALDAVVAIRGHADGWEPTTDYPRKPPHQAAVDAECLIQARIARDVFGNPFRPPAFAPEWRTGTVLAMARQMFDTGDFSGMPILADALQDAGCDSDVILNHCRDPEEMHVLGCWVVDLVLATQ